jgi:threonine synthase
MNGYSERTLRALELYGINPHSADAVAELEEARRSEMETLGQEACRCSKCRKAYPTALRKEALCPICFRFEAANTARIRSNWSRSGGRRVPDGLGCTERLPDWSINWDGNPDA